MFQLKPKHWQKHGRQKSIKTISKNPIKTALLKNTTYTWCGAGWGLAESDDYNDFNESVKQYTIGIYNATQLKYVVLKNVSTILPTELENYESQLRG